MAELIIFYKDGRITRKLIVESQLDYEVQQIEHDNLIDTFVVSSL